MNATTEFTYEIEAISTQDEDNGANLVLTIIVNPVLRFLSDPDVDGIIIPPTILS